MRGFGEWGIHEVFSGIFHFEPCNSLDDWCFLQLNFFWLHQKGVHTAESDVQVLQDNPHFLPIQWVDVYHVYLPAWPITTNNSNNEISL